MPTVGMLKDSQGGDIMAKHLVLAGAVASIGKLSFLKDKFRFFHQH